jgi:cell division protein FtsB
MPSNKELAMQIDQGQRRSRRTILLILGVLLLGIFAAGTLERVNALVTLREQAADVREDIQRARQQQAELQDEYVFISSPRYIEEVARAELGLIRPGDDVIVLLPQSSPSGNSSLLQSSLDTPAISPPAPTWWQRFLSVLR